MLVCVCGYAGGSGKNALSKYMFAPHMPSARRLGREKDHIRIGSIKSVHGVYAGGSELTGDSFLMQERCTDRGTMSFAEAKEYAHYLVSDGDFLDVNCILDVSSTVLDGLLDSFLKRTNNDKIGNAFDFWVIPIANSNYSISRVEHLVKKLLEHGVEPPKVVLISNEVDPRAGPVDLRRWAHFGVDISSKSVAYSEFLASSSEKPNDESKRTTELGLTTANLASVFHSTPIARAVKVIRMGESEAV